MAIIKFNAALAIASASLLSIFCIQKNKKREHCFTVIGEEENIENDEGDSMEIHFSSTPRNKRIIADAVGLRIEPWGFSNPHIASLLAQLRPSPFNFWNDIASRRFEKIKSPSGCYIEVEFVEPLTRFSPDAPMVILLPGIGGHSREVYIEQATLQFVNNGWNVVILNYSIVCHSDGSSVGGNCLTETKDISFLVSHLRKHHSGFLAVIGFSMGGSKLAHYLLRTKEYCNLDAACTISSPLDYTTNNDTVHQPNGKIVTTIYHFIVSSHLKLWILKHYNVLRKHHLLKSAGPFRSGLYGPMFWLTHNSVPDIDRAITMPLNGRKHDDLNTYYNEASALQQLGDGMSIPFLCITAMNDPFIPPLVRPTKEIAHSNENIFVVNTRLGGHIGYWMPEVGCWGTNAAISFFNSVMVNATQIQKRSSYVRQASSIDAATLLQRSSRTGLSNYFDFMVTDSCSDLLKTQYS